MITGKLLKDNDEQTKHCTILILVCDDGCLLSRSTCCCKHGTAISTLRYNVPKYNSHSDKYFIKSMLKNFEGVFRQLYVYARSLILFISQKSRSPSSENFQN